MKHDTSLGSKPDKKAIADAIQRYLDANGLARKDLIREHLSKSTIEKLFQGDFSDRTLNKVEGVLKTSFQKQSRARQEAASKTVGAYVFEAVEYLQGDYLCVRPVFANPTNLSAYLISIVWSDEQNCLVFEEKSRFDAKYRQVGTVYIPVRNVVHEPGEFGAGKCAHHPAVASGLREHAARDHQHARQSQGLDLHSGDGPDLPAQIARGRGA